jgi:hypothetical protein
MDSMSPNTRQELVNGTSVTDPTVSSQQRALQILMDKNSLEKKPFLAEKDY